MSDKMESAEGQPHPDANLPDEELTPESSLELQLELLCEDYESGALARMFRAVAGGNPQDENPTDLTDTQIDEEDTGLLPELF